MLEKDELKILDEDKWAKENPKTAYLILTVTYFIANRAYLVLNWAGNNYKKFREKYYGQESNNKKP